MDIFSRIHRKEAGEIEQLFFSESNIHNMQKALMKRVKLETGVKIEKQPRDNVLGFMFETYNQYYNTTFRSSLETVQFFNDITLNRLVSNTKNGLISYSRYLEDSNKPHEPLSRGVSTTLDKTMEFNSLT